MTEAKPTNCIRCQWGMVETRYFYSKKWVRCLHVLKTYELVAEIPQGVQTVCPPDWCPLDFGEMQEPTLKTVEEEMEELAWWRSGGSGITS